MGELELTNTDKLASCWQVQCPVVRVGLAGDEQTGVSCLNETRSVLEATAGMAMRLVEVGCAPDLLLVAGPAEWAQRFIGRSRGVGDPIPIVAINLTPGNGSTSRILDAGADDCLAWPFDPSELAARMKAVMRRIGNAWARCPEIAADRGTLRIRVREVEARVSRMQFDIFVCLAESRERWVHSDEIIATVSRTHHHSTTSLVRVQIHGLRKALGARRACIRCDGRRSYMLTMAEPATSADSYPNIARGPARNWSLMLPAAAYVGRKSHY
jgi:DNA-binding response OmpR family regulator